MKPARVYISTKEARKLLGVYYSNYSDEEIKVGVEKLVALAKVYIRSSQTVG